jgi:hypothetical protein
VPSIPRRQDLVVGALLLGSMAVLTCAALSQARRPRWLAVGGAAVLFFLALGGKEIAYGGLALVPVVLACGWARAPNAPCHGRRVLLRSALIALGFGLVEIVAFGVRWAVLGGLGGYYGSEAVRGSLDGVIEFFVRPYVGTVLWPVEPLMPGRLRDWLIVVGAISTVVGVAIAGLRRPLRLMALLGLIWQAAFLLLYIVVHTSLSPYLLYVPLAGLGLLVSALLDGAAERSQRGIQGTRVRDLCLLASAVGSLVLLLGIVRTSTLVTLYPEFHDASSVSSDFLDGALPCLSAAPPNATVEVDGLPHRIDYGSAESQFIDAYVFEAYSLESAVRLLTPNARARVEVGSIQDVTARPRSVSVTCSDDGDRWQISTRLES